MLRWLNRRHSPVPINPGQALAKIGKDQQRAKIRAQADVMREKAGLPPALWPPL